MDLNDAFGMAVATIDRHGLIAKGWTFKFDNARSRFGCCKHGIKTITLSRYLVELNDQRRVLNTILHEIAHALVGPKNGHNKVWKRKAIEIGCTGERCYTSKDTVSPPKAFKLTCPACGKVSFQNRVGKLLACGACCRKHNGGRWSKEYILKKERNA